MTAISKMTFDEMTKELRELKTSLMRWKKLMNGVEKKRKANGFNSLGEFVTAPYGKAGGGGGGLAMTLEKAEKLNFWDQEDIIQCHKLNTKMGMRTGIEVIINEDDPLASILDIIDKLFPGYELVKDAA